MKYSNTHNEIETLAVLFGGGISLLAICNMVLMVIVCVLVSGCGSARKVERMQERQMRVEIGMVEEMPDRVGDDGGQSGEDWIAGRAGNDGRDTTVVMESDEPIIMNAVRDEDGNMVAGKIARARPSTAVVC